MEGTASGYYIPGIARSNSMNSQEYREALFSITWTRESKGDLSADGRYRSTQAVLRYLDGKETVRVRGFGRERWRQCMTYLKYTLPSDEFQQYCDKINEKRGLTNRPDHKNYVSPENFGASNLRDAYDEVMERVDTAEATQRDYASLLALYAMDPAHPVDRRLLANATRAIMEDAEFQYLAQSKPEELKKYVRERQPGDGKILTYRNLAESLKTVAPQNGLNKVEEQEIKPEEKGTDLSF